MKSTSSRHGQTFVADTRIDPTLTADIELLQPTGSLGSSLEKVTPTCEMFWNICAQVVSTRADLCTTTCRLTVLSKSSGGRHPSVPPSGFVGSEKATESDRYRSHRNHTGTDQSALTCGAVRSECSLRQLRSGALVLMVLS